MVKSIEDLLLEACVIRDAEDEKENTALRVGTMLVNLLESLGTYVDLATLREVLESYAQINSLGLTVWHQSRVVPLVSMGSDLDNVDGGDWTPTMSPGDIRYNPSGNRLELTTSSGIEIWTCRPGVIYVNMHSMRLYAWSNAGMTELSADHTQRRIIADMHCTDLNEQEVGTVGYYPSTKRLIYKYAERGWLRLQIDANAIYCDAANNTAVRWYPNENEWVPIGSGADVANNLNTNDSTKALSAKMGKVLRENLETLNANIVALNDALANSAFKDLPRPTMDELDFGGDKYAVTVNNTLSGCSSNKTGAQQVSEGSNLVVTITADNGKMLRSVTSSTGVVAIAANKESATITISNVMSDMSVSINANATAKGSFTATISDSRVSGTGATSGIVEGSAWSSQLSINSTAEDGATITSISATMAGGGTITVNGNTVNTDFVTGNITIVANVSVVVTRKITKKYLNITDNSVGDTVDETFGYLHNTIVSDSDYSTKLSAVNGAVSNDDVRVKVGNKILAQSEYTFANGQLTIPAAKLTDDIIISATAATGVVSATANVSGATVTLTKSDNTTATITCDTSDGNGGYTGSVSGVTSIKNIAFSSKTAITALDFGGAQYTTAVGNVSSGSAKFNGMSALVSCVGLVLTSSDTRQYAFSGCSALAEIQTIGWAASVNNHSHFSSCTSLQKIDAEPLVSEVTTNCYYMFRTSKKLYVIAGLEYWDTKNVTSFKSIFESVQYGFGDNNSKAFDFSRWDTSKVTTFGNMFLPTSTQGEIAEGHSYYLYAFATEIIIGSGFVTTAETTTEVTMYGDRSQSNIKKITVKAINPPTMEVDWIAQLPRFAGNSEGISIVVPAGRGEAYRSASGWSTYAGIIVESN